MDTKIHTRPHPGKFIPLGDLQRKYRAAQNAAFRNGLRQYLFDGEPAAADVFFAVSRLLYGTGAVDKAGLEDAWLASASEVERAIVFTRIMTRRQS
jgi:hypothetical protein